MRKLPVLLAVVCLAALAGAQTMPPDSVCEVHVNKVKPGQTAQYEQARMKHMAWHKAQNDTWSWETYEITTGENSGDYLISTCGHAWKDFDREKFNAADAANAGATMGPYLEKDIMSYYTLRQDLSAGPPSGPPTAYLNVIFFHVKPEGFGDFINGVKQVNQAFTKTNAPHSVSRWYSLANGGHGPELVLVQERKTMGDMEGPSPKTLDEIMKEAYGDQGATTMTALRKAYYQNESVLLHYRPDLSYTAPVGK